MTSQDVEYYLNGKNFKEFGVYVSASSGYIGKLQPKERLTVDWNNRHGIASQRGTVYYKPRTITLTCFIEADGRADFLERVDAFCYEFYKANTARLKVEYDGDTKPLIYEVEADSIEINKKWSNSPGEKMVGTFTLKLVENEPVKKILRFTATSGNRTIELSCSTVKPVNIYWGDGSVSYDFRGIDNAIKHTYTFPGTYEVVITGVIEELKSFTTNADIIWNLLK